MSNSLFPENLPLTTWGEVVAKKLKFLPCNMVTFFLDIYRHFVEQTRVLGFYHFAMK